MQYYFKKVKLEQKERPDLSGFGKRSGNMLLGPEELYASVLWLKLDKNDVVLFSIDSLYIPESLSTSITTYLESKYNVSKDNILINASHTHSAPGIEPNFVCENSDEEYLAYVEKASIGLLDTEQSDFKECTVKFSQLKPERAISVSRRRIGRDIRSFFIKKRMLMLPNRENVVDDKVRIFSVSGDDNELAVVMFNLSCHPVFNTSDRVSSDFPGEIRQMIRESLGADSIFLQGFQGDTRPFFTSANGKQLGIVNRLKALFNKEVFRPLTGEDFCIFTKVIFDTVKNCLITDKPNVLSGDKVECCSFGFPIVSETFMFSRNLETKLVLIDKRVLFIGMNAEVASGYYLHIAEKYKDICVIPSGNGGGMLGYLPFYTELVEGGYEVNSSTNYGYDSVFSEDVLIEFMRVLEGKIDDLVGVL